MSVCLFLHLWHACFQNSMLVISNYVETHKGSHANSDWSQWYNLQSGRPLRQLDIPRNDMTALRDGIARQKQLPDKSDLYQHRFIPIHRSSAAQQMNCRLITHVGRVEDSLGWWRLQTRQDCAATVESDLTRKKTSMVFVCLLELSGRRRISLLISLDFWALDDLVILRRYPSVVITATRQSH